MKMTNEEKQILKKLQKENPNLESEFILKAIISCRSKEQIVKKHETFINCVKERITLLRLMQL